MWTWSARWLWRAGHKTDAERTRFHDRYLTLVDTHLSPLSVTPAAVVQIEVISAFRRVELMTEEHDAVGDSFGRGGTDEVVEALRPWRGKTAIDVYLQLATCNDGCAAPPTDVAISGIGTVRAGLPGRTAFKMRSGGSAVASHVVESVFDAAAIGQRTRGVDVVVGGKPLAHAVVEFSVLD